MASRAEVEPPSRILRVDMHCHTRSSFDCLSRPADVLRAARAAGIDRLVISDHNEIDGALRLQEIDPELILVGEEIKTRERVDVIGIFLSERIAPGTPAREACERVREQGGVVYIPHPFDLRRAGGGVLLSQLAELIDVVEVHNSRTSPARNAMAEAWAEARDKPKGAGSDAHTLGEIGRGYVETPPFDAQRGSFLAALRLGQVAGRTTSSSLYRLASGWARVRKRLPGA